ncbi:MAG: hypothetical protein CR982_00765 [Candidatus Cloacimonadota bacterium]|nr:MAG: hypothetical protein CR982_00765 [Candidatus Cloacimonadota bacterium]PIE79767.1 MAG: hypothetical protein CSA15_02670 [Candidatus Delongbacteria bacterium]
MLREFILIVLLFAISIVQGGNNHPELKWYSFETEHFVYHYHNGTERTANETANVAEHVYDTITDIYDHKFDDKIHVVIKDYDDYANGYAAYYNNKIELWAPNLDTELRGTHNWIRDVFTHEFTHMVQLQTSKKLATIPSIYLQYTGYESEKRKDIVNGFPNVLTSYSIPMNIVPGWFAEGVAQNQDPDKFYYDFWDANRDMVLRERLLTGQELSYDKLSDFGNKSSHEAESVYNTGMAFVSYLFERFGRDVTSNISKEMSSPFIFSFDEAIENVTGIEAEKLYNDWIEMKRKEYSKATETIEKNLVVGDSISDGAFVAILPKISPNGKYIAYLSSKKGGEISYYRRDLYIKEIETDKEIATVPSVSFSSISWSEDSENIIFSRHGNHSMYGNKYLDVYIYNIESEKEKQITFGERATNPIVSNNGKTIIYVSSRDGNQNIYRIDISKNYEDDVTFLNFEGDFVDYTITQITDVTDGSQYYIPRFNNDNTQIVIAKSAKTFGRDIVIMDLDGNEIKRIESKYELRNPTFGSKDKYIYYSSDKTGIFNIYRYNLDTDESEQISNVRGAAFYPDVKNGKMVYSNYEGIKFDIYRIDDIKPLDPKNSFYKNYVIPEINNVVPNKKFAGKEDRGISDFESMIFLPRILVDKDELKPGFYFTMTDYLDKINLFGGFAINKDLDYDLFAMTEYKFLLPTLYGEFVNIVKHTSATFDDSLKIIGYEGTGEDQTPIFAKDEIDYTYNLREIKFGLNMPINHNFSLLEPLGDIKVDAHFTSSNYNAVADYGEYVVNYDYYKAKKYNINANFQTKPKGFNYDINPVNSRSVDLSYTRVQSKFIQGFEVDSKLGNLVEEYKDYNFNQYNFSWTERIGLPFETGLVGKIKSSFLDTDSIAGFYNDYIGGISGLKGYSFYSIGGTRTAYGSLEYRFPIMLRKDIKFGFLNLKKIYGGVFFEAGTAWCHEDGEDIYDKFKYELNKDLGFKLRVYAISFYGMPTAIEYNLAYGLDTFVKEDVEYGKELRHYLTILFGYPEF